MASVFLSYDHEDSARAAPIAAALESKGHSVWWDRRIHGGAEYNSEIETAVERSDAVVVLWSDKSVRSPWVRDEAGEGRDRGKLVPVLIEAVKPPMGFRQYQTIDLCRWSGGKRIPALPDLLHAIEKVAATPAEAAANAPASVRSVSRPSSFRPLVSRRSVVAGGGTLALAAAGGGIWWATRSHEDPRVKALLDDGYDQIVKQTADEKTARLFEQASAIEPNNARAWGLLALLKSFLAPGSDPKDSTRLVNEAEKAARHALSLDPKQADALLAMYELQGSTLDWIARDQKLRQLIAIDPDNIFVIDDLALLTAATGLLKESWDWNERALVLQPLNKIYLGRRALKLWIWGRISEADKVSDQLRGLYPTEYWPWFVRVQIYAFTGRAGAALRLLDSEPETHGRSPMGNLLRATLPALEDASPGRVAAARRASIEAAAQIGMAANEAILVMSGLRELDTAFDIANGTLLSRGPLVPNEGAGTGEATLAGAWRVATQWMWVPPVAAMRTDSRFGPLCDGIGLTDYWRKRGINPDFMRR
jgi:tetratricopeptide (TPR) repeat protein